MVDTSETLERQRDSCKNGHPHDIKTPPPPPARPPQPHAVWAAGARAAVV